MRGEGGHPARQHVRLLILFAVLYVAVVAPHFSKAYVDFGDGNYLYISRRMTEGVVLYRDILAPQPPCHLLVGSGLIRLGRLFSDRVEAQLYAVRTFSLLLHLATMVLVWSISLRLFGRASTAIWGAGLYLIIPVGFWWTLGYQSECLEVFFLLLSFRLLLRWTRPSAVAAGIVAALAVSTNMTAVCYGGWIGLSLLYFDWRRALYYILPAVAAVGAFVGVGEWLSGGHYLENVVFNQVGTFPHPDLLGWVEPGAPLRGLQSVLRYAAYKIAAEGGDVMAREGIFIAAAVAGLLLYLRPSERPEHEAGNPALEGTSNPGLRIPDSSKIQNPKSKIERAFVGWYGFWSFLAIGFVAKGATMDYIVTIGEPFICIFAAYALTDLGRRLFAPEQLTGRLPQNRPRVLVAAVAVLGLTVLLAWPALWIYAVVHNQAQYELDAESVERVQWAIAGYSRPGDAILAPPYYAFISNCTLIEEHSEFFIWDIQYRLEQLDEPATGPATAKIERIAAALREKAIPVVVHTMDRATTRPQQIYSIPVVKQAIEDNYEPLLPRPIPTLNTRINILVPRM